MIPIYSPRVYRDSAQKALESGWISSQGEYIELATRTLKEVFGVPYGILMNNGTSATHMLIQSLKYKHPGLTKIYVPNNVFVAVWNAVLYEYPPGSIEVTETDPETLNMRTDEAYIRSLDPGSAVVVVHNIGNIVNVPRLKRLRPDIVFVEDNCEGLFGKYEGIYSGTSPASLCSAVSFFANKTITSGEGGAFFTHDKELYDFIYKTIHHGATSTRYVYDVLGRNYRMTNIQAALLYDQLVHVDSIRVDKHGIFNAYRETLGDTVVVPKSEDETAPSEWMFVCGLKGIRYEDLEGYMKTQGVDIRPFFYDISVHGHLKDIHTRTLLSDVTYFMLPSYPDLTLDKVRYVCRTLNGFTRPGLD
jgi:perosamine synthetase